MRGHGAEAGGGGCSDNTFLKTIAYKEKKSKIKIIICLT